MSYKLEKFHINHVVSIYMLPPQLLLSYSTPLHKLKIKNIIGSEDINVFCMLTILEAFTIQQQKEPA